MLMYANTTKPWNVGPPALKGPRTPRPLGRKEGVRGGGHVLPLASPARTAPPSWPRVHRSCSQVWARDSAQHPRGQGKSASGEAAGSRALGPGTPTVARLHCACSSRTSWRKPKSSWAQQDESAVHYRAALEHRDPGGWASCVGLGPF